MNRLGNWDVFLGRNRADCARCPSASVAENAIDITGRVGALHRTLSCPLRVKLRLSRHHESTAALPSTAEVVVDFQHRLMCQFRTHAPQQMICAYSMI